MQLAGKAADLQGAQAEQRQALSRASLLAEAVLRDTGHNPTTDLMRRINSTLEALSTYSSLSDTPAPGRLTADVNPPGFESLASLIPTTGLAKATVRSTPAIQFTPSLKYAAPKKVEKDDARIRAAKAALDAAEQALREARTKASELAAAQKKAAAEADEAEKNRREAEERCENARRAEQEARKRLDSLAAEAEKAARALSNVSQAVEKARKGLNQ